MQTNYARKKGQDSALFTVHSNQGLILCNSSYRQATLAAVQGSASSHHCPPWSILIFHLVYPSEWPGALYF